jgi:hypothetical protein
MKLFISKDFLNLPYNLEWNDDLNKFKKIDNIDIANRENLIIGTNHFKTFCQLYLLDQVVFPPEPIVRSYKNILKFSKLKDVPWNYCMPQELFISTLNEIGKTYFNIIKNLDLSYLNFYEKGNEILYELKEATINKERYELYKENPIAKTFIYNEQTGLAEKPIYSRTDTVTGRLSIDSGANILHLKQEYRNIITSGFGKEGQIYYFDIKSAEPKLLLYLSKYVRYCKEMSRGTCSLRGVDMVNGIADSLGSGIGVSDEFSDDIYIDIINHIPDVKNLKRKQIKDIVLAELYGAGLSTLKEQIPELREFELLHVVDIIRKYFSIDEIKKLLINEFEKNNRLYIQNFYGRYISTSDIAHWKLLNRYTQSSAVDIALLCFSNMINYIKQMNWENFMKPLFVLHDALFIDIHQNYFKFIPTICKIGTVSVPLLENVDFFLKVEKINE